MKKSQGVRSGLLGSQHVNAMLWSVEQPNPTPRSIVIQLNVRDPNFDPITTLLDIYHVSPFIRCDAINVESVQFFCSNPVYLEIRRYVPRSSIPAFTVIPAHTTCCSHVPCSQRWNAVGGRWKGKWRCSRMRAVIHPLGNTITSKEVRRRLILHICLRCRWSNSLSAKWNTHTFDSTSICLIPCAAFCFPLCTSYTIFTCAPPPPGAIWPPVENRGPSVCCFELSSVRNAVCRYLRCCDSWPEQR